MLIKENDVKEILDKHNINVKGVLHIGAHKCEEMPFYCNTLNIPPTQIIWIDAIQNEVYLSSHKGFPNVFCNVISDKDNESILFYRTNNNQSSSILELGTHRQEHPNVHVVETTQMNTITIDSFFSNNGFDARNFNFWNLDIQGAEYKALLGGIASLPFVDALYLEVNVKELYKGCTLLPELDKFLTTHGFTMTKIIMTRHGWGDALFIRLKN